MQFDLIINRYFITTIIVNYLFRKNNITDERNIKLPFNIRDIKVSHLSHYLLIFNADT